MGMQAASRYPLKFMSPKPLLALLVPVAVLPAAPITWIPAVDTTGKSQLVEGPVVHAFSGGSTATVTGGGAGGTQNYTFAGTTYQDLIFMPTPGNRSSTDISNGAPSTGDADFDTIIKSLTDTQSGITSGTQTIGGLTDGTLYQVQVFFNDQRNGLTGRIMTFGDGEVSPNTVDVTAGGTNWGQHAVGSFTADGTTQSLTHATNGFGNVHVNAILVMLVGSPPAPDVPANLAVVPGDNRNHLNWDDNTQPGFLEFRIKRSTTPGGPYTQVGTTSASAFTDNTALNGTTYYYVVSAVNIDLVESANSDETEGTPSPMPAPPNFVFIITDDQDTYSINAYRTTEPAELTAGGQPYGIDTPHIDRLATEGMLFHQARLMGSDSGAVCRPSRTQIMTGKNTWERTAGVNAAVTFPGIFNRGVRSGLPDLPYATYRTCKVGNSYPTANNEFTVVNDSTKRGNTNGNGSEWHGDRGIDFIDDWEITHRPNGKPFFIYLGFSHPHDERNARTTPDLTGRYGCVNTTSPGSLVLNPLSPPLPVNHLPANEALGVPANFPFHPFDFGHLNVRDEVNAPGILQYRTEAVVRNEIGRNFACVDWIDQQVGRILDRLEDPNDDGDDSDSVLDNTYIVFTSDHGIAIGRHGLQGKQNLYEHTWRVPYIVRGPGIAAGSRSDALVYLHDSFPTFCDLAGLDLPATIDGNDGQSFRSVLEGGSSSHRDHHYGIYAGGDKPGMRAVTDGRFKLIKYDVDNDAVQVTQMFDLETNPYELLPEHGTPNIATLPAYAALRQDLEEELMQQRVDNADPYAFLGDRTLLRFDDGTAGQPAATLDDRFPFNNDGTAMSGTGGPLPVFSNDVPHPTDQVIGEPNVLSLDFESGDQQYVELADDRGLDFGAAPFTIEAWVKLESLPTGPNDASRRPVAMKKATGAADATLDYMFLAAAGSYGDATNYANLALHLGSGVVISNLSIPDTAWHHISAAFDPVAGVVRFTLDDLSDTVTTTHSGIANNGPLVIGALVDGTGTFTSGFDGLIDEFSITDGFLDLAELQPLGAVTVPVEIELLSLQLSPDQTTFSLTFESDETRLYHIQRSTTLEPGNWTDVRTFIPGAPGATETTVSNLPVDMSGGREFFRVST